MMPQPLTDAQRAAIAACRPIEEHVPAHWREHTIEANGIRQHYWRTGAGGDKPALVLLHGTMGNGLTWSRLARAVEAEYDVVMPDARGHGRSDGAATGFRTADMVADVAALIRALDLERPVVLGHSMGASTAAYLAADHPELVRAAILEDPAWRVREGRISPGELPGYRAWLDQYTAWFEGFRRQPFAEQVLAAAPNLPPGAVAWPEEDYVAWVAAYAQYSPELLRLGTELWAEAEASTVARVVGRLSCPVLVIFGARPSPMSPYDKTVTEASPYLRVVELPTGHFVHLDDFDGFLAVVRDYLRSLP